MTSQHNQNKILVPEQRKRHWYMSTRSSKTHSTISTQNMEIHM